MQTFLILAMEYLRGEVAHHMKELLEPEKEIERCRTPMTKASRQKRIRRKIRDREKRWIVNNREAYEEKCREKEREMRSLQYWSDVNEELRMPGEFKSGGWDTDSD